MKALLVGGANPCSHDDNGLTALHLAVWNGKEEAVLALLANPIGSNDDGIKVSCLDQQTTEGFTALHLCAWQGRNAARVCRLLLLAGADASITEKDGRTAEDLAREEGRTDLVNILASWEPSREASKTFKHDVLHPHKVVSRRKRKKDKKGEKKKDPFDPPPTREDCVPLPPELQMHEHRIWPHAQKHHHARRSAEALRQIIFAEDQLKRAEARRKALVEEADKILD